VEYVASLQELLTDTPFATATSLSYEERPPSAGLVRGILFFSDGSQLDFREFLITHPALRVIKYGYHYRMGRVVGVGPGQPTDYSRLISQK